MAQNRSSSLGDVRRLFQSGPEPEEALPSGADELASRNGPRRSAKTRRAEVAPQPRKKVRATFHVYDDTLDQAKNAVVTLMGPPLFLTLSELLDTAIHDKVIELQNAHNNSQPFPPRPGNLRGGRPLGS